MKKHKKIYESASGGNIDFYQELVDICTINKENLIRLIEGSSSLDIKTLEGLILLVNEAVKRLPKEIGQIEFTFKNIEDFIALVKSTQGVVLREEEAEKKLIQKSVIEISHKDMKPLAEKLVDSSQINLDPVKNLVEKIPMEILVMIADQGNQYVFNHFAQSVEGLQPLERDILDTVNKYIKDKFGDEENKDGNVVVASNLLVLQQKFEDIQQATRGTQGESEEGFQLDAKDATTGTEDVVGDTPEQEIEPVQTHEIDVTQTSGGAPASGPDTTTIQAGAGAEQGPGQTGVEEGPPIVQTGGGEKQEPEGVGGGAEQEGGIQSTEPKKNQPSVEGEGGEGEEEPPETKKSETGTEYKTVTEPTAGKKDDPFGAIVDLVWGFIKDKFGSKENSKDAYQSIANFYRNNQGFFLQFWKKLYVENQSLFPVIGAEFDSGTNSGRDVADKIIKAIVFFWENKGVSEQEKQKYKTIVQFITSEDTSFLVVILFVLYYFYFLDMYSDLFIKPEYFWGRPEGEKFRVLVEKGPKLVFEYSKNQKLSKWVEKVVLFSKKVAGEFSSVIKKFITDDEEKEPQAAEEEESLAPEEEESLAPEEEESLAPEEKEPQAAEEEESLAPEEEESLAPEEEESLAPEEEESLAPEEEEPQATGKWGNWKKIEELSNFILDVLRSPGKKTRESKKNKKNNAVFGKTPVDLLVSSVIDEYPKYYDLNKKIVNKRGRELVSSFVSSVLEMSPKSTQLQALLANRDISEEEFLRELIDIIEN